MHQVLTIARGIRIVAFIGAALLLGACAKTPGGGSEGGASPASAAPLPAAPGLRGQCRRPRVLRDQFDRPDHDRMATLNKQVMWLQRYPRYVFTVEGHADERGTREYNIALGARRATTVRDYFVAHGIAANRMQTISYGKERPVAVCNDISCWSQNRRAVTVLNNAGV